MLNRHEAWGFPSGKQRNVSLEGKAASLSQYSKRDLYAKQKKERSETEVVLLQKSLHEDGVAFHSAQIQTESRGRSSFELHCH